MKNKKCFTLIELMIVLAIIGILAAVILPAIFGYDDAYAMGSQQPRKQSADAIQTQQTAQAMAEAQRQVGMPGIVNFQQRKLMKLVYEQCDKENLICYAYLKSDYTGKLTLLGKCIGYGIPFSAQFTNPARVAHRETYQGGSFGTLPQADPNGLFMPTSSSATWLMMIDPATSKSRPVYIEPEIVVSPFKLK